MYTIRPDKPVNPILLEILSTIQTVTGELDCDYLLVGATARNMLMTHVFASTPSGRLMMSTSPSHSTTGNVFMN